MPEQEEKRVSISLNELEMGAVALSLGLAMRLGYKVIHNKLDPSDTRVALLEDLAEKIGATYKQFNPKESNE